MQVDPQFDVHALRQVALDAFEAFRQCLPNNGSAFDSESPGALGDELFFWQTYWPKSGETPCDGGHPGPQADALERAWHKAFTTYIDSDARQRMLRAGAPHALTTSNHMH
jgi:hypothetical protein